MADIQAKSATITIANNTTISASLILDGTLPCAIQVPSGWTAADVTVQASLDNGTTWGNVYDKSGSQIKVTSPTAGAVYAIDFTAFVGLNLIRLVSSVAQGADRIINVAVRDI